jgi:hypothetical protein
MAARMTSLATFPFYVPHRLRSQNDTPVTARQEEILVAFSFEGTDVVEGITQEDINCWSNVCRELRDLFIKCPDTPRTPQVAP